MSEIKSDHSNRIFVAKMHTYTSNVKMDAEAVITPYWHH